MATGSRLTSVTTWLRRAIWLATAAFWAGLCVLTHTPVALPTVIVRSDKTGHFIGYLVLATALFASLRLAGRREPMLAVLAIGLAYGVLDELLQIPVGRSCELNDWFADAAGVAVAVTLGGFVTRWRDRPAARSSW